MKIQLSKCDPKNELTLGYSWLAAPMYASLRNQFAGFGTSIQEALQDMENTYERANGFKPNYIWV